MSIINISQIIEELESIAGTGTRVPGLRKRMMVDIDRLLTVAEQLRESVPADIQEANEVLKQKDSIVNQAHLEARRTKDTAAQEAEGIVAAAVQEKLAQIDETEIVRASHEKADEIRKRAEQDGEAVGQDAQRRAYQTMDEAEAQAAKRKGGADQYARETLFALEERLATQLGQVRRGIDALGTDADPMMAVPTANGTS